MFRINVPLTYVERKALCMGVQCVEVSCGESNIFQRYLKS